MNSSTSAEKRSRMMRMVSSPSSCSAAGGRLDSLRDVICAHRRCRNATSPANSSSPLQIGRAHVYSSHSQISYAVFCLKKKKKKTKQKMQIQINKQHTYQ